MKRIVLLAATCLSFSASHAAVTYTFEAASTYPYINDYDGTSISGSFSVTVADFITTDTDFATASDLSACAVDNAGFSCGDTQRFLYSISANYSTINFLVTYPDGRSAGPLYYFDLTAFTTLGVHTTVLFGTDQAGVLTVTGSADPAVPEPASWAMMVGGFGMLGGALRSRRMPAIRFA